MSATWIQGSSGLKIPESAVVLGKGDAHSSIYVGSILHEGKRVLAQVHPSKKAAYFHRQGQDIEMLYYKILCAPNTSWIKFDYNDKVPANSLLVTLGTDSVYIGRSIVSTDKIYVGTIQPKEGMSVDFYGESAKLSDCEILVSGDTEQEVTNVTNTIEAEITEKTDIVIPEESTPVEMSVFNYHTNDLPDEADIETDSGLIEYEELEERTAYDEYGTHLEFIEEHDENV